MGIQTQNTTTIFDDIAITKRESLSYLYSDHLGSTSRLTDEAGTPLAEPVRYLPFGGYRGEQQLDSRLVLPMNRPIGRLR